MQRFFVWLAFLYAATLLSLGCTPQSAAPEEPITIETDDSAELTVTSLEGIVIRSRAGEEIEISSGESEPVKADDEIQSEPGGRATLEFPGRLTVELFEDTTLELTDAKGAADELYSVNLFHSFGSSQLELDASRSGSIGVDTTFAEISANKLGTSFYLCHPRDSELTCVVVVEGEVRVMAKDPAETTLTVHGSQAIIIPENQAPRPVVCVDEEELGFWRERKVSGRAEEVEILSDLVARWPEAPSCADEPAISDPPQVASATPITETPTIPPTPILEPDAMTKIESGLYVIGSLEADEFHVGAQEILVDEFWIDLHEVTNADYRDFVDQNNRPPPAEWSGGVFAPGREEHPVKGVTWHEAEAYCRWRNKRLPTEAEWEIAARGPESFLYPWGSNLSAGGIADSLPSNDTHSVHEFLTNMSGFGVYHMAGNVWEWVDEPYDPFPPDGHEVIRGGRHGYLRDMAYRQTAAPDDPSFVRFAGFRCAISGGE